MGNPSLPDTQSSAPGVEDVYPVLNNGGHSARVLLVPYWKERSLFTSRPIRRLHRAGFHRYRLSGTSAWSSTLPVRRFQCSVVYGQSILVVLW